MARFSFEVSRSEIMATPVTIKVDTTNLVKGIDIYRWDGVFDGKKAYDAGLRFVFVKASQGLNADPMFKQNWANAKAGGLLRSAYHFLDYTASGLSQGNFFASIIKDDPGEMPPVMDFEQRRPLDIPRGDEAGHLWNALSVIGERKMIYTGWDFWLRYGKPKELNWAGIPLWNAHPGSGPLVIEPWGVNWTFWQYIWTADGATYGVQSKAADLNYFNGTYEQLVKWCGSMVTPLPQTIEQRLASLEARVTYLEHLGG
jgi:lysozyme